VGREGGREGKERRAKETREKVVSQGKKTSSVLHWTFIKAAPFQPFLKPLAF
jgi:hypothetical protein